MNRRDFFKYLSLSSLTPATMRLKMVLPSVSFLHKLMSDSLAADFRNASNVPRNYVHINFYGAPARWGFDSVLKPFSNSDFLANPFLGNTINKITGHSNEDQYQIEYKTVEQFGINFPSIWNETVTTLDGEKPLNELLKNILTIRGCRLNFEGHPINGAQQIAPILGGMSLNGMVADVSNSFFSSVSLGSNPVTRAYKSKINEVTEVPVGELNYAEFLLKPFVLEDTKKIYSIKELENIYNYLNVSNFKGSNKNLELKKWETLKRFKSNVDQFSEEFSQLFIKYSSLIAQAKLSFKRPIKISSPSFPIKINGKQELMDIIGRYSVEDRYFIFDDLFDFVLSGDFGYWAQEFALCEFLLKNNLCQSIVISPLQEIGFYFSNCRAQNGISVYDLNCSYDKRANETTIHLKKGSSLNSSLGHYISMDSHKVGAYVDILSSQYFYKLFATCLYEFINSLKKIKKNDNLNLFDETVIHIASEFDRRPNLNGYGSEHNFLANVTSVFSGAIEGPLVIGNVFTGTFEKNKEELYGTVGVGAPNIDIGGYLTVEHVSSTLSHLLRVPPIALRSSSPLMLNKNSKFESILPVAQNVKGYI